MSTSIDLRTSSKMQIIAQLLKLKGQTNGNVVLYKKTAVEFKNKFGIELSDAPVVFTAKQFIWKLVHITYKHKGRTYESATYHPIVGCANFFQSIQRNDILV